MDFSRSRSVHIYSEVTPTRRLWGFFGNCLWDQLVKHADRAGVLALPEELQGDLPAAVASVIGCDDAQWVRQYLPKLMEHGSLDVSSDGSVLVLRNYHDAQYGGIDKAFSTRESERKMKDTRRAIEAGYIEPPSWWLERVGDDAA